MKNLRKVNICLSTIYDSRDTRRNEKSEGILTSGSNLRRTKRIFSALDGLDGVPP